MRRDALLRMATLLAGGLLCACAPLAWPAWPGAEPTEAPEPALVYDPPSELPAPEGVSVITGAYREIPLRWDPVLRPDVGGYLVEASPEREGPFTPAVVLRDRGVLGWVDRERPEAPLGDGTTRFYRLRAFDRDEHISSIASEIVVATTARLPAPPEGLFAYSRQPRSIPLAWDASPDPIVSGYTVERSPGPDGPFEVVAELEGRHATHLLDQGLGDLRVLYYRVLAKNPDAVRGPPSEGVRAVTKPEPLPPISLHVVERSLGTLVLGWGPNVERDLLGYRLRRWRDGESHETVTYVGNGETQAADTGVGAGDVLFYEVVAVDRDGLESRPSEPVQAEGVGYEWQASATPDTVRLHWNPRTEEGFVRARVRRSDGWWRSAEWSIEGAGLVDRDVRPGRTYRYEIVLERENGPPAPPSRPVVIEVPDSGEPFVEIQAPASRIPSPKGIPR